MAWNEPGNSGDKDKNRDPWGNRPNSQGGPPDLDEVFKNFKKKLAALFGGGGRRGGTGSSSGQSGGPSAGLSGFISLLVIILVGWLIYDSVYFVEQAQRGVVTRFGRYDGILEPGLNIRLPRPIDNVEKIDVSQLQRITMQAQLLTKDLNLIRVSLVVLYKINDKDAYSKQYLSQASQTACPVKGAQEPTEPAEIKPTPGLPVRNYITDHAFEVKEPRNSLRESLESALREIVGGATMDEILAEGGGRDKLVNDIKDQIQSTIDKYRTGYIITKVNLESVQPPEEVQKAYRDAVGAKEDFQTLQKQAQAYRNDVLPKAEGDAERLKQEAIAYREQVIRRAEGETQRFLQNLAEYQKAPEVTRKRMYLEAMEYLLSNSSKVVVKVQKGNNVMYLPIDKFMNRGSAAAAAGGTQGGGPKESAEPANIMPPSSDNRSRNIEGRTR